MHTSIMETGTMGRLTAIVDVLAVCISCASATKITNVDMHEHMENPSDIRSATGTVCVLIYTKCRACTSTHPTKVSPFEMINGAAVPGDASEGEIWTMYMSDSMSKSLHGYTIASKLGYTTVLQPEFEFMNRNLVRCIPSIASTLTSVNRVVSKDKIIDAMEVKYLNANFF